MKPKRTFPMLIGGAYTRPGETIYRVSDYTIAVLFAKVQQLEKRIEQLEVKTKQNSQNSTKPT